MTDQITFAPDFGPKNSSSIIKVVGVGGGGGNAVKHMYTEGIKGVDFLICNTDRGALEASPIPEKLVLGDSGLGAGANPSKGKELAEGCIEKIKKFIGTETQMLFITAGMGKGTGTGASPIVAKVAREMGILTIGVVTTPFFFEGGLAKNFATDGINNLKEHVDSLIVIENDKLLSNFGDLEVDEAYSAADNVLKNAVKCIAEIINDDLEQNIDFEDIKTITKNSRSAMLGIAEASGDDRVTKVFREALTCPILQEEEIRNAKNFLFCISYGSERKLKISELTELTTRFSKLQSEDVRVIWGKTEDSTLGDRLKLAVVVTDFRVDEQNNTAQTQSTNTDNNTPENAPKTTVINLDDIINGTTTATPASNAHTYSAETSGTYRPELIPAGTNFGDDTFSQLINTPAYKTEISQSRQTIVQETKAPKETRVNNDLHEFFRSNPD